MARIIVTGVLFCTAAMAQVHTYYIPQIAAGGNSQLKIGTKVTIVNLGTEILNPARVTIESYDEDGNPANLLKQVSLSGTQAVGSLEREIEGRGAAIVETYSSDGSLKTGWARLTTDDNVAIEAVFSLYSASGALLTTTSILPREALASTTLLINLNAPTALVTALAALNSPASEGDAEISYDVYDQFGRWVGSGSVSLAPGHRAAKNWTELVSELGGSSDFIGSAEVTSSIPVFLLPLRQDGVQLTTQDALAAR